MSDLPFNERTDPTRLAATIPAGFTLGVATSAYQIEGAAHDGGRGPSSWDVFCTQPGRIIDGSSGEVADDHYHRLAEDLRLMRHLGIDSYRFSLSWPRIQPGGAGRANREGLAFYDRLIDGLLDAGIAPMATLFHWDTPLELEQNGGWLNRDTALRFGDFAHLAAEHFGDRVARWVTINEPATLVLQGYGLGVHAPGLSGLFSALPAAHHQLLGHGLAVQAIRSTGTTGQVGITNVHTPVLPASDSDHDAAFAALFDVLHNRIFADPVLLGHYPEAPEPFGPLLTALAEVPAEDLSVISQPLDFYGLNYYFPTMIRAGAPADASTPDGESEAMRALPFSLVEVPDFKHTGFGWPIAPEYFTVALAEMAERYGDRLPPIQITESGASFPDTVEEGRVDDRARIAYLHDHLAAAIAGAPGIEVTGYHVWTLLDNFEWAAGFTQRFGLVHVDFESLERTPKASYEWLATVLASRTGH